jgi:hypothetical protein
MMRILDKMFTEHPCYGARRLSDELKERDLPVLLMTITDAVTQNFEMQCKEKGGLLDALRKQEKVYNFECVEEKFQVIGDDATLLVVADRELAGKLREDMVVSPRELQMGSVNIRHSDKQKLNLPDTDLPEFSEEQYDDFLGRMKSLVEKQASGRR